MRKGIVMNVFEKTVYFLSAEMNEPSFYGPFHIAFILLTIALTTLLVVKFKDADERTFKIIVLLFWAAILILEVYKQIVTSFDYIDGTAYWRYRWHAFPFQLCSMPLYVLPIILVLKDSRLRDAFISFSSYYLLVAGIAVMIYPGNVFGVTVGTNIQTMFHHGTQVVLGIYFAVRHRRRIDFDFWLLGVKVMTVLCAMVIALNVVAHKMLLSNGISADFNMFFLSPYHRVELPILSDFAASLPYPAFVLAYILVLTLGSAVILFTQKLVAMLAKGVRSASKLEAINLHSVIFYIIGALLAVAIQLTSGKLGRIASFTLVVLCAFFALIFARKSALGTLTVLGLIFTVCADTFLVLITDGNKLVAMIFFFCVQIFYFLRVLTENRGAKLKMAHLTVRVLVLTLAFLTALFVLGENKDALSLVSILYFANLCVNVLFSFFNFKRAPMFAIGLLLFAFCDVFVGFSMIGEYISLSENSIIHTLNCIGINMVWLFYAPSQILISSSSERAG